MLFRAWDNVNKRWLLGYDYKNLGGFSIAGETMLCGEWTEVLAAMLVGEFGERGEDLLITQYIGIIDKNNKKIYCGDRMLAKRFEDDSHFYCEVFYNTEKAAFMVKGAFLSGDCYFQEIEECEVIGNVYQHPTLTELIQSN